MMKDHIIVKKKMKKFSILGIQRVREKIARDEAKKKSEATTTGIAKAF